MPPLVYWCFKFFQPLDSLKIIKQVINAFRGQEKKGDTEMGFPTNE